MTNNVFRVILCACLVLAGARVSQAAPFQNGSFESTNVSGTFFVPNGDSSSITGWTATTSGSSPNSVYISDAPQSYLLSATNGTQVVALNNDNVGGTSAISQTMDTVIGQMYQVLFDLSREVGTSSDAPPISVAATGTAPAVFVASPAWVTQSYTFLAASTSTTLSFSRTSAGQGFSPVLDNVRLNALAIPEPLTITVWSILGLVATGVVLARQRRSIVR